MKTLSRFLVAAFVIAMVATCKKDDPVPPSLIGAWRMSTYVAVNCTDPADNESTTCTTDCEIFTFSETTITFSSSSGSDSLPYTKTATTITVVDGGTATVLNYIISGTTLTLTYIEDGCNITMALTKL